MIIKCIMTTDDESNYDGPSNHGRNGGSCNNFWSLMIACSLFLLAQLMLIFAWALVWLRRQRQKRLLNSHLMETSSTHSSGLCSAYSSGPNGPVSPSSTTGASVLGSSSTVASTKQLGFHPAFVPRTHPHIMNQHPHNTYRHSYY